MSRRTTIEIDDVLVREAARILGAKTLRETVERALREIVRAEQRRKLAEELRSGVYDLNPSMQAREQEWRPDASGS